jgi:hypothetical protein
MAAKVLTARVAEQTMRALQDFARQAHISTSAAADALLTCALGQKSPRAAELLKAFSAADNSQANGSDELIDEDDGDLLQEPAPVPAAPPQKPQVDVTTWRAVEALIANCWGLHDSEVDVLYQYPHWVLSHAETLRRDFMAFIQELPPSIPRDSGAAMRYLQRRLEGALARQASRDALG